MSANPKGELIDYCKGQNFGRPEFVTIATGPNHKPNFVTEIKIDNEIVGRGEATLKREAERLAAMTALRLLRNETVTEGPEEINEAAAPWPIFPEVLSRCLEIANMRLEQNKHGAVATKEVRILALELYKGLIRELGEYS